ncbi:hypothetical protein SUGI_0304930 [Cryptomeria japonica]|nr:hypothetical protein SUGI_0304930 [Cryptomeria japonica]
MPMTKSKSEASGAVPLFIIVLVMAFIYIILMAAEKWWTKRATIPLDCCFPFVREYGQDSKSSSIHGAQDLLDLFRNPFQFIGRKLCFVVLMSGHLSLYRLLQLLFSERQREGVVAIGHMKGPTTNALRLEAQLPSSSKSLSGWNGGLEVDGKIRIEISLLELGNEVLEEAGHYSNMALKCKFNSPWLSLSDLHQWVMNS